MTGDLRDKPIFVTGATGYIGGRLVPRLLDAGFRVRCLVRQPRKLGERPWFHRQGIEIVTGDARDGERLTQALRGCGIAYYLIHSMSTAGRAYQKRDRRLAEEFGAAARQAGLSRIIYLGGLGEMGDRLSRHLASRREVERALSSGGVPITAFRAAMIIGSGSASFALLRYLVERLPLMATPRWTNTECQPIAVRNALHYLITCLDTPATIGRSIDIGGPEILSYRDLLKHMADARGLRRYHLFHIPFVTPRFSSLMIHLVTPVGYSIVRPLVEGLRNRVVCRDDTAQLLMPQRLLTVRESIDAALGKVASSDIETTWLDSGAIPGDPDWAGGTVYVDQRRTRVRAPASVLFRTVCRVGGRQGWYASNWLWQLRGVLDRLIGGPGLARGRPRDDDRVAYGDVLDFWRVTGIDAGRRLELRGEMRLPGTARLEFEVHGDPEDPGRSTLIQTAQFKPKGLMGLAYWFSVLRLHGFVFSSMLDGIRRHAELRGDAELGSPIVE
jgi:uncharacterized protein YbjT (DUF2867 family)